ncbi:MAG: DUF5060 domain-containing protein, partial [Verrucomicrobiota bacterium]
MPQSTYTRSHAFFLCLSIFLAFTFKGQAFDFEETDGILIVEAEDANNIDRLTGAWRVETGDPQIDPFDTSQDDDTFYRNDAVHGTYIRSLVRRELVVQEGRLSYIVKINTPGTYRFVMRGNMLGPEDSSDQYNDIWMRIRGHNGSTNPLLDLGNGDTANGAAYEKAYTLNWSRSRARDPRQQYTEIWHWEGKREYDESFDFILEAAEYELNVAPRARGFGLDRMVLFRLADENDSATDLSYRFLNGSGFVPSKGKQHQLDQLGYSAVQTTVSGELKRWHKTTLNMVGPVASENDDMPNPFMDYRMLVTFHHPDTNTTITTPGYFAADGNAANTGATSGDVWRAHFSPPEIGQWSYEIDFREGDQVAIQTGDVGTTVPPYHAVAGTFDIIESDKTGIDFRAANKGKLLYTGKAYPEWSGGAGPFIKAEANIPEAFLNYKEFDNRGGHQGRDYAEHLSEWQDGDPTWETSETADKPGDIIAGTLRGKGIIGAVNYLSSLGVNGQYFLTMNLEGDNQRSFPWNETWNRLNTGRSLYVNTGFDALLEQYDVSKLDQWEILFDHMMSKGMHVQLVLSEQENQSFFEHYANLYKPAEDPTITFADTRKLFYYMMVARFGYLNAVTWNIGEENGWQTDEVFGISNTDSQKISFATYLKSLIPSDDQIVIHNPLFGGGGRLEHIGLLGLEPYTGISVQGDNNLPSDGGSVELWRTNSANSGRQWIVSYDEPYTTGEFPNLDQWRKNSVWAAFAEGAAGVGFYNSRDQAFQSGRGFTPYQAYYETLVLATSFMQNQLNDITLMNPYNSLISSGYCLANPGNEYVIYLPNGGTTTLDLSAESGGFKALWFDARNGGSLALGSITSISGGGVASLGNAPNNTTDDWVILVIPNTPPTFLESPIFRSDATEGLPYSDSIFGSASDVDLADTVLTYSKVSGPAWLSVGSDGTLSGTPGSGDMGENVFIVAATDASGFSVTTNLNIEVLQGVFTPLLPVVHYDASDESSITKTGDRVTTWADIGTGELGEDITVSGMTQNGSTALDSGLAGIGWSDLNRATVLDGSGSDALFDFQNGSATGGFTIMGAVELITARRYSSILSMMDGGQTPNIRVFVHSSEVVGIRLNDTSGENAILLDQAQGEGQTLVFGISYNANTGEIYYWDSQGSEGTSTITANGDFSNENILYLGGNAGVSLSVDANFGEIRIYDDALSAEEFTNATDDMVTKWVESDLTGGSAELVVHYDASNASSITKTGDSVTTWANIATSSFGDDIIVSGMTQNSSTALDTDLEGIGWRNLERAPVLDGSDSDALFDFLNGSATGGFTIMVALETVTVDEFSSILSMMDGGQMPNIRTFVHGTDVIGIRLNDTTQANFIFLDQAQKPGQSVVFGISYSAATGRVYYWDSQGSEGIANFTPSADFSNNNILYLGGNAETSLSINANFGEIRIYDDALSPTEFALATDEMVGKWIGTALTEGSDSPDINLSPSNVSYFKSSLDNPVSLNMTYSALDETIDSGLPRIRTLPDGGIVYSYIDRTSQATQRLSVSLDLVEWYNIKDPSSPISPSSISVESLNNDYERRSLLFTTPPPNIFFRLDA